MPRFAAFRAGVKHKGNPTTGARDWITHICGTHHHASNRLQECKIRISWSQLQTKPSAHAKPWRKRDPRSHGPRQCVSGGSGGLSSAKPPPTHFRRQAPAFAIRDKLSRMPPYPVPQAAITVNPETGQFGFKVWFAGKKPHYVMAGAFATKKDALEYL